MREAARLPPSIRIPLEELTGRMRQNHESLSGPDAAVVEDVVTAVLDTFHGRLSPSEAVLLREVAGLGRIIKETRNGIAEVSLDAIRDSHLPSASAELGAIVEHTALATTIILECCEVLDTLAGALDPAPAAVLCRATTRMYEACGFQDITGQRITKVVKALLAIETRVAAVSAAYASRLKLSGQEQAQEQVTGADDGRRPESLLNGPLLPAEAMGQDDIDALLAGFD